MPARALRYYPPGRIVAHKAREMLVSFTDGTDRSSIRMYKRRNEVERLFRRLQGFHRIFSRFEKLDVIFLDFIVFALIFDALR